MMDWEPAKGGFVTRFPDRKSVARPGDAPGVSPLAAVVGVSGGRGVSVSVVAPRSGLIDRSSSGRGGWMSF